MLLLVSLDLEDETEMRNESKLSKSDTRDAEADMVAPTVLVLPLLLDRLIERGLEAVEADLHLLLVETRSIQVPAALAG